MYSCSKMLVFALVFLSLCTEGRKGAEAAEWVSAGSLPDGSALYACVGDTVTFNWEYLLSPSDVFDQTTWRFDGHSQEMIAMKTHGHFIPLPVFGDRVTEVGNAGISVDKMTLGDSGNYSVELDYTDGANVRHVLRSRVSLVVSDGREVTSDGHLYVTQGSQAVLDPITGRWVIQLSCGNFLSANNPPFNVQWITPSGEIVNSTNFSNHHFHLTLPSPVSGLNYTCRVPPQLAGVKTCLHGNAGQPGEATILVDKTDARLSLLEKENVNLRAELEQTKMALAVANSSLSLEVNQLKEELALCCDSLTSRLNQTNDELSNAEASIVTIETESGKMRDQLATTTANLVSQNAQINHIGADLSNATTSLKALEIENVETKEELARMNVSQTLQRDLLELTLTNMVSQMEAEMTEVNSTLAQEASDHDARLAILEEGSRHQKHGVVAFHATNLQSDHPQSGAPLVFSNVKLNEGHGYDSGSGYFTAPVAGVYFFVASTGTTDSRSAGHFLVTDTTILARGFTYPYDGSFRTATVHGTARLHRGQRVYVRGDGSHFDSNDDSLFSGFLLFTDP